MLASLFSFTRFGKSGSQDASMSVPAGSSRLDSIWEPRVLYSWLVSDMFVNKFDMLPAAEFKKHALIVVQSWGRSSP